MTGAPSPADMPPNSTTHATGQAPLLPPIPEPPLTEQVKEEIREMVEHYERNRPRSLQKALGPSEIGHPCHRKLAYSIAEANDIARVPHTNVFGDVMPTFQGSAAHERMEKVLAEWNEKLGRERYISERRLEVWPGLTGSCDCYDKDRKLVLDWKFLGRGSFDKYRRAGFSLTYRRQVQLYGQGYVNAGYEVDAVGIMAFPRAGTLAGAFTRIWDFEPRVWQYVQQQWAETLALIDILDVEHHPERLESFATTPENCQFCPWFAPAAGRPGCPGDRQPPPDAIPGV